MVFLLTNWSFKLAFECLLAICGKKCRRRRAGKLFFENHFLPVFTRNDDIKMMAMTRDTYYILLCILHTCYTKVPSWERVRYPLLDDVIFFSLSLKRTRRSAFNHHSHDVFQFPDVSEVLFE